MATEAEIIPEPISVVKTEEESSKHLTLELSDKAVEFLPGDLKKFQGGFTAPAETDECLAKAENMEVASNNGVETMNTVSQGNPEISKGESFLISPEISKASNETCGMSERSKVDDTPFKAEKIPEDKEKTANVEVIADQDSSLKEKCGNIEEEMSHSQESENEGTKRDENADIESNKQEANLELKKQASIDTPVPIIDSLKEANEIVTKASNSNLVQQELEEKSFEEVRHTKPEKQPALVGEEEGTEAIDPIETSGTEKDQIISDSIGYTLTSTVAETSEIKDHETTSEISVVAKKELQNENPYEEVACVHEPAAKVDEKLEEVSSIIIKDTSQATIESSESDICKDYANSESEKVGVDMKVVKAKDKELAMTETSDDVKKDEESTVPTPIDVVKQSQEGKSENEAILKESFKQQNEPEKEKPASPFNAVYEDVNAAICSETSETSTSIKESKEKDLQVEVNENTETVEVEISNKNADGLHVTDSLVGESVEKEDEKQYEFSGVQPEEQVHEAIGASKEKQEHSEDVSETCQSRESTNSEHKFTETATTTDLKPETSEMDKENVKEVSLLDSEKCSESNEALESQQEEIQKELEDCTAEKPELKDAIKTIEDNLKQEETKEVCEGSKSIIKEECAIIDDLPKSTEEEEGNKSFQEDEKEETPEVEVSEKLETDNTVDDAEKQILEEEDTDKGHTTLLTETMEEKSKEDNTVAMMSIKEVCKEPETAASGTGKENPEMEEHLIADISNSSISDETVKESIKEDESSPMKLTEKDSDSNIEETTLQTIKESKEEITPTEVKEDLVHSSSFELEESKKDTEETTLVEGSIETTDLEPASAAAETKETNLKEAEAEAEAQEKKQETDNVVSIEENSLATTGHEGISVDSADIDVKPAESSISCEKDKEISREEDGMQDKVPNAENEDQMEKTTREIPLKEIVGDEVKEYYTLPSEENEPTPTEETKITDENSEKGQAPYEHSETPVPQAADEILMKKEDNPTLDVPKVESEETGQEYLAEESYVHTEQEAGECISVSEVANVSKGEEPRGLDNQSAACGAKTLQDEQSSDLGLEKEKTEDGKLLDEATDLGETSGTCKDVEKAIQEEDNLAKNLAKAEETEVPKGDHDQIPEVVNMNENAKNVELALTGFEEKPKSDSEPVAESQSQETFPEPSKSQADETITDVQNQESEKQIKEEPEDKLEDEDYINSEQNANEVTKAVILSEEVHKEVEKADDSEDIKEHVMEEESSKNELHPESKGDEKTNEVEDHSSVSTECLKEGDSKEQVEAKNSEVEEHSTKDREASLVIEESEDRRQDEESGDPVSVHGEDKESEEKIKDIVDESKLCQDESDEAVTKVQVETSLNDTKVNEELVNFSSAKTSPETSESVANQETKEVENVQLEEISSDLAPHVPNDNDEVEKQSLNVEIVDKDVAELTKRDPEAVYMSKDQIDEAEKSLTVEKADQLLNNDHELVETKSEASKASNVDELAKIELASVGDYVSGDKGTEQDAETKKSLTAEEPEADKVEQTKAVPETSSEYISQRVEATVEDDIGSHNTLAEEKPEEQLQTSASTLPSEDEEIRTAHSIEKIEEEIQKDAEIVKHESLEDSSDTKTIEDVCLQKEEEREPKAVSVEETIVDRGLQKEEQEEQIQTTTSTLPSEEKGHGTGATSEEAEYEKTKEEVPTKQDIITGDRITGEQTLAANEPEEGTASSALLSKEEEQSLAPALPSENIKHETTANEEEEKEKEICLEKERPREPEDVVDQETTVAQASITKESLEIEAIGAVEKLEEEERKEAEKLENEHCEDSSARETEEKCLQKEEPNELHAVPKEEIISGQTSSDEQLHTLTSAIISEKLEHETKKTEDEIPEDARTTEEICSQKERSIELESVVEDEMTAGHTLTEKKSEEQVQNPSSALPSKEEECGSTSTTEKIESEKIEEEEFLQDDNGEDVSLQKERLQEDEALAKDEDASSQTLPTEKSEEQIPNPVVTLPSDETINEVDKTEEEKAKEEEMQNEESDGAKIVEEVCSEKDETRVAQAVLECETNASQVIAEESQEYGTVREEAETMEDDKSPPSECVRELQSALEVGATAAQTLPGEKPADQLHITTSTLPSEKHEKKETELQEDESPGKIPEQTREVEEASNVKVETREKAFDNELLIESEDAAIKEKLLKEEVLEDKEVSETSNSTSHPEEPTKDGSGEDELKDKLVEDEALETTQNEELVVEAQKSNEYEIIEKQVVCEDKTVEDPGQASVARIETATVTEEESSVELSQADSEGTKDHVESSEIIDDIQKPEETTNIASDNQIPRELDPIENAEITSSIGKEHVPMDLQDRVAESSQKAEVEDVKEIYPNEAEVDHGGKKITDNSGEEITEESTSVEDSTKVSSSDHIESSTKETLQVTQDMIKEREARDEMGTAQILLVEKPEEQSSAPSSKLPSEEGEHCVTSKVDAVEEKEMKEVQTLDKDSSDTKTGSQICLEKEEKKELKAVVEQETIVVQAPTTEIKEDLVPHFEDGSKEDELKDEHTGDKTNETLKIPTYEIQNEKLPLETLKDGANNNIEKQIVAEDKTVKDLEQAPVGMKEAIIVSEEIPGEADPVESRTTSSIGKEDFPTEQQDRASETTEKPEAGDLEPGEAQEVCHGEEKTDNSGVEITQEPASADSGNLSLSDLLQRSTGEKMQVAERVIEERELTVSKEEPHVKDAETIQAKEAKTDEEKDGEEGDEHNKTDSGSDAPVMVEAPRDTDTKPHKKSQNILSGVGSKVKHSISKVKKAITGKSSHSKEPKPISPKGSEK